MGNPLRNKLIGESRKGDTNMEKKEIEIIELGLRDKDSAVREAAVQAFVGRMEKTVATRRNV